MGSNIEAASLWLVPDGDAFAQLGLWIDRLAERFRTAKFPPHVTLLSGLSGDEAALVESTRRAAAALEPLPVHLDGVEGRDEHFRCLFVRAVEPGPLAAAHAKAAEAFSRSPDAAYLPHLSLVYGSLPAERKLDLAHEAGSDLDVRFEARRLHLWSTAGPVSAWREIATAGLGRG